MSKTFVVRRDTKDIVVSVDEILPGDVLVAILEDGIKVKGYGQLGVRYE